MEKMESKQNKSDFIPSEYLKMYEISGQDSITQNSFDKYLKDKQQDSFIKKLSENPSSSSVEESIFIPKQKKEMSPVEIFITGRIRSIPKEDKASFVKHSLENGNIEVQKAAVGVIKYAPSEERVALIKQSLENSDFEVQKASVPMAWFTPEAEKLDLFNFISKKGLGGELIKSPLYEKKEINDEDFSRQKFEKTGSETTLIGGELKNKIIIRHIKPKAFVAWQDIFENYKIWQDAGFDYVPIEPIVSYRLDEKKELVDVYTGILDLSLDDWSGRTNVFKHELIENKNKIIDVLKKLNIKHGHTHDSNFCLRFFRDENGQPDFNRVPRIYLIDFDQAVSSGK